MAENVAISPKKLLALQAFARGAKAAEAAEAAGVKMRTIERWRHEPDFVDGLHNVQDAVMQAMSSHLLGLCHRAVARLEELLDSPSEAIKLRAAVQLIDGFMKWRDLADVESRLSNIEELVARKVNRRRRENP
jgi:hypothetical protein